MDIQECMSDTTSATVHTSVPIDPSFTCDEGTWREHEELLNKWRNKLFVQLWLQEHSMYFYSILNNVFTYPIIVISSLSSAALLSTNSAPLKYTVAGLSLVTGILTAISRQMKPAELYQQHALTTLRYQTLLRMIDTYVNLPPTLREEHPTTFMKRIEADIATLMETQINPPPFVKHKFEKNFGSIDRHVYGEEIMGLLRQSIQWKAELEATKKKRLDRQLDKRQDNAPPISGYMYRSGR
jgi:hypothetical protein